MRDKIEIMMVAGEVSGDLQAASLAKTLFSLRDDIRLFGTGGSRMEKAGVELVSSTVHLSSVGIIEALGSLPQLRKILKRLDEEIERRTPRLILLVDNQGFNLQLAKRIKRWGIPILYWFPPQVWAFAGFQAKQIAKLITHILAVFRFEEEAYLAAGARVSFVGHPFLDTVQRDFFDREKAYRHFGIDPRSVVIGLLPGSRIHEIKRHLPLLLGAAKKMAQRKNIHFLLPLADPVFRTRILNGVKGVNLPLSIVEDHPYDALSLCELLITASGSATLEAAILKIPMVIIYKMSPSSWFLSRHLVRTSFAGMPNILARKMIVPELLQGDLTSQRIVGEAFKIIDDRENIARIREDLSMVVARLGEEGGLRRTAKIILGYL